MNILEWINSKVFTNEINERLALARKKLQERIDMEYDKLWGEIREQVREQFKTVQGKEVNEAITDWVKWNIQENFKDSIGEWELRHKLNEAIEDIMGRKESEIIDRIVESANRKQLEPKK